MFVKYDENKNIISLLVGCVPEDMTDYIEEEDNNEIITEYFNRKRLESMNNNAAPSDVESRVAALESQLVAYENAYFEGVNAE